MKLKLLFGILILYSCGDSKNTTTVLPPESPSEPEVSQPPPSPTESDSEVAYTHELVIDGIDIPWGIAFIDEDNFLVTEKQGTLYHVTEGNKVIISGLPNVYFRGQGGLLDVALHPDYQNNQTIYLTLSYSKDEMLGGNTALYSAKLDIKLDFMAKKGEKPLQCLKKRRFKFVTLLATYFLGFIWIFKDNTPFERGS